MKQRSPISLPLPRATGAAGNALARSTTDTPQQTKTRLLPHDAQNQRVVGVPAGNNPGAGRKTEAAPVSGELIPQLKRWLALVRSLESSMAQSRDAILRLDADGILKAAAEQESLCGDLRRVQTQLSAQGNTVKRRSSFELVLKLSPAERSAADASGLQRELTEAQRKVQYTARLNASLLQRCARNAAALRNLYLSCLGTYTNPAAMNSMNFGCR